MQRRSFIKLGTLSAVSSAAIHAQDTQDAAPPSLVSSAPILLFPTESSILVAWKIKKRSKGYIEFGIEKDSLNQRADSSLWGIRPSGEDHIIIKIDNLKPNTSYYYRTATESFDPKKPKLEHSEVYKFTTLGSEKKHTHFTIWNDTHKRNSTIKALLEKTPEDSDFMLWNGDISNDWHHEADIPDSVLSPAEQNIPFPVIPLRGNHDHRGAYASEFQQYVSTPGDKPWLAFRTGPVAVICLDTGEDKADDHPALFGRAASEPMRKEQAAWLEKIIQKPEIKNAPYRIVCCHIPLRWLDEQKDYGYDWYSKRSRDLWHNSLVKWGAQAIISGHTHRSAFIPASKEFPYIQLIGGGKRLNDATLISCQADHTSLAITSKKLDDTIVSQFDLKPLS